MNDQELNFVDEQQSIAIIGGFCRFPGADSLGEFWCNLMAGTESIRFFSDAELLAAGVSPDLLADPRYVKAQGVLEDIAGFDAAFFGLSPGEAEMMDPQHRIFLEGAWEALEDAGYDPERYDGRVGVFGGSGLNNYLLRSIMGNADAVMSKGDYLVLVSSDKDFMPTRVSYKLNLRGPSISVSTACSTSLVAVDLACQSLLSYQTDMALAGAVSIQVPHHVGYLYEEGGTQSADGHCRSFDKNSSGLVGGSGAGIVVLKRLEDALADGDNISAVIKGSAVNNDGSFKAGYTAPSVEGQAEVIAQAQANAGVHPESIGYIEAHGTGTRLGDPIEIAALTQAFRGKTQGKGFCRIGSVKSNIGHLDTAAGMAGLLKTVLALKNRQIPPSLHFTRVNPEIDFDSSPFIVNAAPSDWPAQNSPRRAGVSSFGIGGTNAHLVLQEAPNVKRPSRPSRAAQLLVVSAKTQSALETGSENLSAFLRANPQVPLGDVAFTLAQGRRAFDYRRSVLCQDPSQAADALDSLDSGAVSTGVAPRGKPSLVFMFTGQGSQYAGMGRDLYQNEAVFRDVVDRCAEFLKPHTGCDIRDIILQTGETDATRTDIAQPLIFVIGCALAALWESWGARPDEMIGHSIGQYVAAYLAGVFSLQDALFIVARRGALMQAMPDGEMLAVALSEDDLSGELEEGVSIAAINAPARCVVAGDGAAISRLRAKLDKRDIDCRPLQTSHAFHSAAMDGMLDDFAAAFTGIFLHPPKVPFVSNLSGTYIDDKQATDPAYWVAHVRQCVRFADGLATLREGTGRVLLEVGAGRALCTFAGQPLAFPSMRHPQQKQDDVACIVQTMGKLWTAGIDIDWTAFQGRDNQRISLPTYPFEHKRYWIDTPTKGAETAVQKADIKDWFYVPSWRRLATLSAADNNLAEGPVLLFMDDSALGQGLLDHLQEAGRETVVVRQGAGFDALDAHNFSIRADDPDDYHSLVGALVAQSLFPTSIIHLWAVGVEIGTAIERAEAVLEKGFYSLVYLVQAIEPRGAEVSLNVVTNNIHEVTGEEEIAPEKSTALGPLRVIPLEHLDIRCKGIDILVPAKAGQIPDTLSADVWSEICNDTIDGTSEAVVALRGGHRWALQFEAMKMPPQSEQTSSTLRQNGVYMIAGGLGGIGLELARHLAQSCDARLALVGTTQIPPREQWQDYLDTVAAAENSGPPACLDGLDVEALERHIDSDLGIGGIETYSGFAGQMDHLCTLYLYRYFRNSGLDMGRGTAHTKVQIREHLGVLEKFHKLFTYFLKVLEEDDIISLEADTVTFLVDPEDIPPPDQSLLAIQQKFPAFGPMFEVMEHCMEHYRAALNGDIEAVGVLFPEGGGSLWDQATKKIPEHTRHRLYCALARDIILDIVAKNLGRTLKILEIGAGAGVFTDVLVPVLKDLNVEYTFTDIGKSFVLEAEQKARAEGHDFMTFGLLDVTRDPDDQGYQSGSYDIVLELDAVHATSRMSETMGQVKKLLAPGGVLLFVESVVTRRWMNLPLGLLEGWWFFEDMELRQDSPLLSLDKWTQLIAGQGFKAATYPTGQEKRTMADSGLIVAQLPDAPDGSRKVADKIRALMELESLGGQTLAICADVADKQAMADAIGETEAQFGPLNGFIQTAAAENRGPIVGKVKNPRNNEFLPKIQGTLVVDELLAGKGLDFMMLSSSHSSFDVGAGDVEYCASNSFVDAFANMKARQGGTPVISVNWDRWRSVGMAKAYEEMFKRHTGAAPVGGMSAREGRQVFQTIMSQSPLPPQVIVSIVDFNEKVTRADTFMATERQPVAGISDALHARPSMATSYVAPEGATEPEMARIWQDVLGIDKIGSRDSFYDLGGDSLIAVKVISRMRELLDVELSVNVLFERPTVKELSERVEVIRWSMQEAPQASSSEEDEEEGVL
jgi:acyl transferase domain-containing protein/2-polyprenyl-3-methyl-5-hydroxy-6-metoxy-1,4-benzoquinol methylase/acyl carrier protein